MNRLEAGVIKRIKEPITDKDLERYFPETNHYNDNVIKYSELINYDSIYQLLPKERSYKIILIESEKNSGHWTAIMRYKDTIEYFDSYGVSPDGELKFINIIKKKILGQDHHYLTELLRNVSDKKVIYNKMKFQKLKNGSATCGRWIILRLLMMRDFFYTLEDFQDFINKNKKETGFDPDYLVSLWVK
jgi:hypothetical protein